VKDFSKFYSVVAKGAEATGQKPRIRDYVLVKLVENIFVLLLFVLTIVFAAVALFVEGKNPEAQKWAQNAATLCLGVFLGLFAGRKV
jgi:hypothetical protein